MQFSTHKLTSNATHPVFCTTRLLYYYNSNINCQINECQIFSVMKRLHQHYNYYEIDESYPPLANEHETIFVTI